MHNGSLVGFLYNLLHCFFIIRVQTFWTIVDRCLHALAMWTNLPTRPKLKFPSSQRLNAVERKNASHFLEIDIQKLTLSIDQTSKESEFKKLLSSRNNIWSPRVIKGEMAKRKTSCVANFTSVDSRRLQWLFERSAQFFKLGKKCKNMKKQTKINWKDMYYIHNVHFINPYVNEILMKYEIMYLWSHWVSSHWCRKEQRSQWNGVKWNRLDVFGIWKKTSSVLDPTLMSRIFKQTCGLENERVTSSNLHLWLQMTSMIKMFLKLVIPNTSSTSGRTHLK